MSEGKTAPGGWSAVVLGAVAVACCLAAPALAGLLGGAVLWGVACRSHWASPSRSPAPIAR